MLERNSRMIECDSYDLSISKSSSKLGFEISAFSNPPKFLARTLVNKVRMTNVAKGYQSLSVLLKAEHRSTAILGRLRSSSFSDVYSRVSACENANISGRR